MLPDELMSVENASGATRLFDEIGVRWPEFARLPYWDWDPVTQMSVMEGSLVTTRKRKREQTVDNPAFILDISTVLKIPFSTLILLKLHRTRGRTIEIRLN